MVPPAEGPLASPEALAITGIPPLLCIHSIIPCVACLTLLPLLSEGRAPGIAPFRRETAPTAARLVYIGPGSGQVIWIEHAKTEALESGNSNHRQHFRERNTRQWRASGFAIFPPVLKPGARPAPLTIGKVRRLGSPYHAHLPVSAALPVIPLLVAGVPRDFFSDGIQVGKMPISTSKRKDSQSWRSRRPGRPRGLSGKVLRTCLPITGFLLLLCAFGLSQENRHVLPPFSQLHWRFLLPAPMRKPLARSRSPAARA